MEVWRFHTLHIVFLNQLEIQQSSRDKKKKLGQAFDVIKVNYEGEDMVTYRTWKRLMNLAQPKLSNNQIDLLMLILNTKRSGHIGDNMVTLLDY